MRDSINRTRRMIIKRRNPTGKNQKERRNNHKRIKKTPPAKKKKKKIEKTNKKNKEQLIESNKSRKSQNTPPSQQGRSVPLNTYTFSRPRSDRFRVPLKIRPWLIYVFVCLQITSIYLEAKGVCHLLLSRFREGGGGGAPAVRGFRILWWWL